MWKGAMDPRETAPDSCKLEENAETRVATPGPPTSSATLNNIDGKPLFPYVNAAVPSFLQVSTVEMTASDNRWNQTNGCKLA